MAHARFQVGKLASWQVGKPLANKTSTPDEYLILLDATERFLKTGKHGAIPSPLDPILFRLDPNIGA